MPLNLQSTQAQKLPSLNLSAVKAPIYGNNTSQVSNNLNASLTRQSIPSNTAATNTQKPVVSPPKNPALNTPAAQTFMQNQIPTPQVMSATSNTPPAPIINQPAPAPLSPVSTSKQDYLDAYKKYIDGLNNSKDVETAKTAYNDYVTSLNKGVNEVKAKPIASRFVTGEANGLLNQQAAEGTRLQNDITIAQDAQKASVDSLKAGVDLYGKLLDQEKPVEVGGVLYQVQSDGTYKPLTATNKAAEGFTLGAGQSRYDANGNLIAGNPEGESSKILTPTEAQALGVPYGTTQEQAYGKTPTKPATEAQNKASMFAVRTDDANKVLNNLQNSIVAMNPINFQGQVGLENTTIGNTVVSDEIKQVRQAERNFLNSILRRESGAVISPTEFANGAKQYFPRPGDDVQTLQQKTRNREVAISALKNEAGNSYTDVNNSLGSNATFQEEW